MVKRFLCIAVSTLLLAACGPVDYLNTVTLKATRAVADARAANAERLAPYEYWSALTYLQMAREKVGYADFEDAVTYGEKSEKMAIEAKKLAVQKGKEGPDATHEPPGGTPLILPEKRPPARRPPARRPPARRPPAKSPVTEGGKR